MRIADYSADQLFEQFVFDARRMGDARCAGLRDRAHSGTLFAAERSYRSDVVGPGAQLSNASAVPILLMRQTLALPVAA